MRKFVIATLLLVVLLLSFTYASAGELLTKYDNWLKDFDFDSILEDLESGDSNIVGTAMFSLRNLAETCKDMMDSFNVETDEFTGERRVTHKDLKAFGNKCQVYPFIDEYGLNLFVGFPYNSALHYDKIYLNMGSDKILEFNRSDKEHGFDIQFERLNGKSWEYSLLSDLNLPMTNLYSVSFREKGSVSKVDYVLTETEMYSVNALNLLYLDMEEIRREIEIIDKQRN